MPSFTTVALHDSVIERQSPHNALDSLTAGPKHAVPVERFSHDVVNLAERPRAWPVPRPELPEG